MFSPSIAFINGVIINNFSHTKNKQKKTNFNVKVKTDFYKVMSINEQYIE